MKRSLLYKPLRWASFPLAVPCTLPMSNRHRRLLIGPITTTIGRAAIGRDVGYGRAFGGISVHDPVVMNTSPSLGSLFGGLQFGYNYVLPSRVLIGIETDFSMPNSLSV